MAELDNLSNSELRKKMLELGLPNVPVTDTSRNLLLRRIRVEMGYETPEKKSKSKRRETMNEVRSESVDIAAVAAVAADNASLSTAKVRPPSRTANRRTIAAIATPTEEVAQEQQTKPKSTISAAIPKRRLTISEDGNAAAPKENMPAAKPARRSAIPQRRPTVDQIIIVDDDVDAEDEALFKAAQTAENKLDSAAKSVPARRFSRDTPTKLIAPKQKHAMPDLVEETDAADVLSPIMPLTVPLFESVAAEEIVEVSTRYKAIIPPATPPRRRISQYAEQPLPLFEEGLRARPSMFDDASAPALRSNANIERRPLGRYTVGAGTDAIGASQSTYLYPNIAQLHDDSEDTDTAAYKEDVYDKFNTPYASDYTRKLIESKRASSVFKTPSYPLARPQHGRNLGSTGSVSQRFKAFVRRNAGWLRLSGLLLVLLALAWFAYTMWE